MSGVNLQDFATSFALAAQVIVLGSVIPAKRGATNVRLLRACKRQPDESPAGFVSYGIWDQGYAIGWVFFPEGEGSVQAAMEKWNGRVATQPSP